MIKLIYKILPTPLQEALKLKYYNFKNKTYNFGIKNRIYTTSSKKLTKIYTSSPLYFIVKDVDRYEKYYKVQKDDVVLDCGANDGSISLVYSQKVGRDGHVFSFEPDFQNIVTFNKNKSLNDNSSNIKLVKKGIWDEEDSLVFYESGTVGSSIFYEGENSKKQVIEVVSIDSFSKNEKIEKLNFIKMDIEGAEIEALEGAIESIEKYTPNFAIASYHIVNNEPTYIALETFFKKIKYPYKTDFFDDGEIITYAGKNLKN